MAARVLSLGREGSRSSPPPFVLSYRGSPGLMLSTFTQKILPQGGKAKTHVLSLFKTVTHECLPNLRHCAFPLATASSGTTRGLDMLLIGFTGPVPGAKGDPLGIRSPPYMPFIPAMLITIPLLSLSARQVLSRASFVLSAPRMPGFQGAVSRGEDGIMDGSPSLWPFHAFLFRVGNGFNLLSTVCL